MRSFLPLSICLVSLAAPALAHPGHLAEVMGHGHWGAAIAIGLAAGIAIWAGLKGRGKAEEAEAASGDAPEAEEEVPA